MYIKSTDLRSVLFLFSEFSRGLTVKLLEVFVKKCLARISNARSCFVCVVLRTLKVLFDLREKSFCHNFHTLVTRMTADTAMLEFIEGAI